MSHLLIISNPNLSIYYKVLKLGHHLIHIKILHCRYVVSPVVFSCASGHSLIIYMEKIQNF